MIYYYWNNTVVKMINVYEIKQVFGMYTSQLCKDFYAVDVLVERGNIVFKIRCSYNTKHMAEYALLAMGAKLQNEIPKPDYKPLIWIVEVMKTKAK